MRLLILGASGGCGRWATRLAHEAGHAVTALVRPGTAFAAPTGVIVRRGTMLEDADLAPAVAGQDAVIRASGHSASTRTTRGRRCGRRATSPGRAPAAWCRR